MAAKEITNSSKGKIFISIHANTSPKKSNVKLTVYDLMGRKIRTLVDREQQAGFKSIRWNATNDIGERVASGIYLYRLTARDFRKTRMMILLK